MRTWQLQEARSRLKDVFDAALETGPQRITRHGKRAVVVVSEEEWAKRSEPKQSFGEFLAQSPFRREDLPPRKSARVFRKPPFDID